MSIRRSRSVKRSKNSLSKLFGNPSQSRFSRATPTLEHLESRCLLAVDTSNSDSAMLNIYIDGQRTTIPANLGVDQNDNTADIFTTSNTGKVFFDEADNVTLGDFFETWRTDGRLAGNNSNALFSSTQLLNKITDRTHTLQVFVNGQLSNAFQNQEINDGDSIVMVYSSNTVVSLNTNYGSIVIELFDTATPGTVANFLSYVNDGSYINSFFHRSAKLQNGEDFVIQGGGFKTNSTTFTNTSQFTNVPTKGQIQNEPGISNLRGTVAMAKLGGQPNSATSQFFVNLNDENDFLDDPVNGEFTAFGQVLDMTVADAIADLPRNTSNPQPYNELPVGPNNQLAVIQQIEGQGEVSGVKFNDLDGDGVRDTGEPTVAGATVWVDTNNNGVLDTGERSTTTANDGFYQFHLEPGTYVIRMTLSEGFVATANAISTVVDIGGVKTVNLGEVANARPIAGNDSYTVNEDAVLTVDVATGVLANDTDAEQNPLSATVVTQPTNGTVTLNANGSFTYTPNANFFGTDTFTYVAGDGSSQSTPATVTITVAGQPDPPTATNDEFTILKDASVQTLNVLANDTSQPDGNQTLTITAVTQGSANGTVAIDGNQVKYTPAAGFSGTETFTYTITDTDGLTSTATVTISVENISVNNTIAGFVYIDKNGNGIRDNGEKGVPGSLVTLSGTDNVGTAFTRTAITNDNGAYTFSNVRSGTYKVVQKQPEATIDMQESSSAPGANTATNDQISNLVVTSGSNFADNNFGEKAYKASSRSIAWYFASAGSREEVTREAVAKAEEEAGNTHLANSIRAGETTLPNRAPLAVADAYSIARNGTLTVTAANGVLKNDTDADGDAMTVSIVTQPANGTLTLAADGSFVYKPNAGYSGTDTFTYRVTDGTASSNGTVTLTVTTANAAPQAANDFYTTDEDTTLTVNAADGALKNDTDADGQTLTATIQTQPAQGTVTFNSDGSFVYTPKPNFNGTDSFTYRVSDGTANSNLATVNITVNPVADPPTAVDDSYTVAEDTTLTRTAANGVLANDTDPDAGGTLTATVVSNPSHGTLTLQSNGSFVYTPNSGFNGPDSFTYQLSDGTNTSTATVNLTVTSVNDAPVAVQDNYTVAEDGVLSITTANGLLANDTDQDGSVLSVAALTQPSHGVLSLNADGSFTYTPNENFNGSDSFTYRTTDNMGLSSDSVVMITVTPVEDPAVATADSYTVAEDEVLSVDAAAGLLANDSLPDSPAPQVVIVDNPSNGDVNVNTNGSFTYTPDDNFHGTDSFTYKANDGVKDSNVATVTVTVTPVNDAPVAVANSYQATAGETLSINVAAGILANDIDVDGDSLSAVLANNVANGILVLNADGSFQYTPNDGFTGTDSFTYRATDSALQSLEVEVEIEVVAEAQEMLADLLEEVLDEV